MGAYPPSIYSPVKGADYINNASGRFGEWLSAASKVEEAKTLTLNLLKFNPERRCHHCALCV